MIEIINKTRQRLPRLKIQKLLKKLYHFWNIASRQNIEIIFVGSPEMKKLNSEYLLKKYPTDVLSFPADLSGVNSKEEVLGTIIICPEIIKKQEKKYYYQPYIVHGFMHLMGYDHIEKPDEKEWKKICNLLNEYLDQ